MSTMNNTIYKYSLMLTDYHQTWLPQGAKLLSVQMQNGAPVLWALVDPSAQLEIREIRVYGTGHPVPNAGEHLVHIDTIQDGSLVWHVFELLD